MPRAHSLRRLTLHALTLAALTSLACADRDAPPPPPAVDGGTTIETDGGSVGPALTIAWIDPDFGPQAGGDLVTIAGTGFEDGLAVALGGVTLDEINVIDEHTIEARTPAALTPGLADLVIVNPDGRRARLIDAYQYVAPPPLPITYCKLTSPASVSVGVNERYSLSGVVVSEGLTNAAGQGAGLRVEVGYGYEGFPTAQWTWLRASYTGDADGAATGDHAADAYAGALAIPLPGTYRAALRVSGDNGQSWSYCDRDGLGNGFAVAQATSVEVRLRQIDACRIVMPARVDVAPGDTSAVIVGEVFVDGVTSGAGRGANVVAGLGYGPVGDSPIATSWTWSDARYLGDAAGADGTPLAVDRYEGTLSPLDPGAYDFAFRFSVDGGRTFTYCDTDGSANGYSSAAAGRLVVAASSGGVDACKLLGPTRVTALPGVASEPLRVQIAQLGVTDGAGQGDGIRAQVGFGPVSAAPGGPSWTFTDAAYLGDANGDGPLSDDVYVGTVASSIPGEFATAFRASADDGASWTYCDLDGSQNGFDLANAGRLLVEPVGVGYCELTSPASASSVVGVPARFSGRVFVAGRTPGAGAGSGIRGQIGYGAESASPSTWTWLDATYGRDVDGPSPGDLADDEYAASITPPVGSYRVAARFSIDGGVSWTLCDRTGSTDGFRTADGAALTISALSVGDCRLSGPASATVTLGSSVTGYGAIVYVAGRTPGAGQGGDVTAQLGYGPSNAAPSASSWTWSSVGYAGDADGAMAGDLASDRYAGSFTPSALGSYAIGARVSVDGGATFVYCDFDGAANGFSAAASGSLTVSAPGPAFGSCRVVGPARVVALSGGDSPIVKARVYVAGVTDSVGAGAVVTGQIGYGPVGVAPTDARWVWRAATYARDATVTTSNDADEYEGRVSTPARGTYDLAYRFSVNGGVTWNSCDLDGSQNGYDSAQAVALVARTPIASCALQFPDSTSTYASAPSETIYGRVEVPGVTGGTSAGADVTAQLGYGPSGSTPSDAWSWLAATYNAGAAASPADEYEGKLTVGAAGAYAYTYRFSTDDGQTWCYGAFGGGGLGALTVDAKAIADARIQPPSPIYAVAGAAFEPVYGQLSVPGFTGDLGPAAGVDAQLGYGPVGGDPSATPSVFTFAAATYNAFGPVGAYDEYQAVLTAPAAGDYDLAARFVVSGVAGTVFGDLDGSAIGGYSAAQAKRLVVRAPAGGAVGWCATQWPTSVSITMGADGGQSATVYGRVYKAVVTPGAGWGAGLVGQLGWGPVANTPDTWTHWVPAGYRRDVDGLSSGDQSNDEYESMITLPPGTSGTLGYTYRFSADGGVTWLYCGLGPTGSDGTFIAGSILLF